MRLIVYSLKTYTNVHSNRFYWDSETIEYMADIYQNRGMMACLCEIVLHVSRCHLEDGETEDDLIKDLCNQTENYVNTKFKVEKDG